MHAFRLKSDSQSRLCDVDASLRLQSEGIGYSVAMSEHALGHIYGSSQDWNKH